MTNDKTTREVSQRLKDAGFSELSIYEYRLIAMYDADPEWLIAKKTDERTVVVLERGQTAYSASTLLDALDGYKLRYQVEVKINNKIGCVYISSWNYEKQTMIEFNGSWPDLFAEAIIWILTQEKENK